VRLVTELLVVRPGVLAILPVVAALLWLWAAVAVVIWILRLIRRVRRPSAATLPAPGELGSAPVAGWSSPPSASPSTPTLSTIDLTDDPAVGPSATTMPSPTDIPSPPTAPASADGPAGADVATPFAGVADPPASDEEGRTGFFAPTPGSGPPGISEGGRLPGAGRPTVVEALRGITMPCNLSPVVDGSISIPNPFRVAFLTADADAPTVGAALGDELQRLGFTLSTPAATELLARKPGVELRVILYPTASAARRGLDLIFPAAPSAAVGVELTT